MPSFAELRSRFSNSANQPVGTGMGEMLVSDVRGRVDPRQAVEQKLGAALRRGERVSPGRRSGQMEQHG